MPMVSRLPRWPRVALPRRAGVWLAGVLLGLSGGLVALDLQEVDLGRGAAGAARETQLATETLLSTLQDAETGQRGFLLTGDASYLVPYEDARAPVEAELDRLAALAGGANPAPVAELRRLAAAKMAELARTVALRRGEGLEAALAVVRTGEGQRLMDAIRDGIGRLRRDAAARAEAIHARQQLRLAWTLTLEAGLTVLAFLVLLLAFYRTQRQERLAERHRLAAQRELAEAFTRAQGMIRDLDGRIILWNGGAEQLYGFTAGQAVERISHDLLRTEFPRPPPEIQAELLAAGSWHGRLTHRRADGTRLPVISHWALNRGAGGAALSVVEISHDLSEQVRAEAALRASEARHRALVQAIAQITWSADEDGWFTDLTMWRTFTGQTQEEASGEGWMAALHPDDREATRLAWQHAVETRTPYDIEYRTRRADGAHRWMNARGIPVLDADGALREWMGVCLDIDERKRAEEALRRANDELEAKVAERTRALADAQAQLFQSQKLDAIGHLTGGIAHDFNNLLCALMGNLQLLEGRLADDWAKARLRNALRAADRGAQLTQRLLAFGQRQTLRPEPFDLAELIAETEDLLARSAGPLVRIENRFGANLWPVHADQHQVEMMLISLVTNARDAMPPDRGGTIVITVADEMVAAVPRHPAGLAPGDYVRVSVADDGAGMDAETLRRAFEPFFTTRPVGKGTGLGLAMVHGIAAQSGGGAHIASAPGQGTTVSFWLPRATAPARPAVRGPVAPSPRAPAPMAAPSPMARTAMARTAPETPAVLLVDDDPEVREMTARLLDLALPGARVLMADTAAAAIDLLDYGEAVDLLISDIAMAGMNGVALASEVRRRAPSLPVLLITGYTDLAAIGVGAKFPVLRKPFRLPEFEGMIQDLLRNRPAQTDRSGWQM